MAERLLKSLADVEKLIDLALEKGCATMQVEGCAFSLAPASLAAAAAARERSAVSSGKKKKPIGDREEMNGEEMDEEMLFASSTPPGPGADPYTHNGRSR